MSWFLKHLQVTVRSSGRFIISKQKALITPGIWKHFLFHHLCQIFYHKEEKQVSNSCVPVLARIIHFNPSFFIIFHWSLSPVILWVLEGGPLHFFTLISFPCSLWNTNFPYKPERAKLQAWFITSAVIIYDVSPGNVQEEITCKCLHLTSSTVCICTSARRNLISHDRTCCSNWKETLAAKILESSSKNKLWLSVIIFQKNLEQLCG